MPVLLIVLHLFGPPVLAGGSAIWERLFNGVQRPSGAISAYSEKVPAYSLGVRPYEAALGLKDSTELEFVGTGNDYFRISTQEDQELARGLKILKRRLSSVHKRSIHSARPIVSMAVLSLSRTMQELGRYTPWTVMGGSGIPWERVFYGELSPEWLASLVQELKLSQSGRSVGILTEHPEWLNPALKNFLVSSAKSELDVLVTFEPISGWPKWLQDEVRNRENSKDPIVIVPHPSSLELERNPDEISEKLIGPMVTLPLSIELAAVSEELNQLGPRGLQALKIIDVTTIASRRSLMASLTTAPRILGLYEKPMAQRIQIWGLSGPLLGRWFWNGPAEKPEALPSLIGMLTEDAGRSRLRTRAPMAPMTLGDKEVFWHRPLVWMGGANLDSQFSGIVSIGEEVLPVRIEPIPARRTPQLTQRNASLTYFKTATDAFENKYWGGIARLSLGLVHKNTADCARTDSGSVDPHCDRNELPILARHLRHHHEQFGARAWSHNFTWKSFFNFSEVDGFTEMQSNVIAVYHGKDGKPHDEAIILADHYDTAFMEDIYEQTGHRHSARGADDNYSGTATLLEAAKVLNGLPLNRDVWLVHLTGEEYPADCLGARNLSEALIRREQLTGRPNPKIAGIYLLDMIGHSTRRDSGKKRDVFQISYGRGERALELAETALGATADWNESVPQFNQLLGRKGGWRRVKDKEALEFLPALPKLIAVKGDVRSPAHDKSALYNTDGQIFSDSGFPVVLFMEEYDLKRAGYHDSKDTLANIDLDYARAIAAIAIESVAREASK